MDYEGSTEVLRSLFRKQELLTNGDEAHTSIRPLYLILSGVNKGANGVGHCVALQHHGLAHVFDWAAGVSTGAPTVAYLLAKQAPLGASVYYEECTTNNFIKFGGLKVNLNYIESILEKGKKRIDQDAIRASRTEFLVAVTCARTGDGHLLDGKTARPGMVRAIRASIAMPGVGGPPIEVNNTLYTDGAGALAFPIRTLVERCNPTHILVSANMTPEIDRGRLRDFIFDRATRSYEQPVRDAFMSIPDRFEQELAYLRQNFNDRYGILWSDGLTGSFEKDPEKQKATFERARAHFDQLLAQARGPT